MHLADQAHVGGALHTHVAVPPGASSARAWASSVLQHRLDRAEIEPRRPAAPGSERTRLADSGAARKPSAEAAPEAGGTTSSAIPSARATSAAWAGPAPPKPTMA